MYNLRRANLFLLVTVGACRLACCDMVSASGVLYVCDSFADGVTSKSLLRPQQEGLCKPSGVGDRNDKSAEVLGLQYVGSGVCQLERRGLSHTRYLTMGQDFAQKGSDRYICQYLHAPGTAFPIAFRI